MKLIRVRDGLADGEERWAEEGRDEVPHAGAEALNVEHGERDTRQKTANHLANLFRTSKEEADRVVSGHKERVRSALEQGKSGHVPRRRSTRGASRLTESPDRLRPEHEGRNH
jgi:hypothetical protein